jgi:excisionase family DNA binding protein
MQPVEIPSLDEIARDATRAQGLPLAAIAMLQTRCAAALSALAAAVLEHEVDESDKTVGDALLTIAEVAQRLGLARSYVYELVRTKQLPAVRVGRHVRVKVSEVERFIACHDTIERLDNVLSQRLDRRTEPME